MQSAKQDVDTRKHWMLGFYSNMFFSKCTTDTLRSKLKALPYHLLSKEPYELIDIGFDIGEHAMK